MSADLLVTLREWERLDRERRDRVARMSETAEVLERRARAAYGGPYAKLIGQDPDGRVRFYVQGGGERTFTLEELSDGA